MTASATCAMDEVSRSWSLYRGEQFDPDLGLYYLRARYYNPLTGRFMNRDPEDGLLTDPKSLHRYVYAGGDPVNLADPTGRAAQTATWGGGEGEYAGLTTIISLGAQVGEVAVAVAASCVLNTAASLLKGVTTDLGAPVESITFDYGSCSAIVKKGNCSPQDVETCQNLYPNCSGRQCGSCLSYCLTQCEWPFHKPECNKWKFPKDWKDFPPPPIWIN